MTLKKKNHNNNKLKAITELQNLFKQYHILVDDLSSIFTTEQKQEELQEEIKILEDTLKSKLTISSLMRGF